MKLAIFLLALGVCINAASISNELVESKFELPSVSALLVTELLETTFHVPADLAQAIGHLFRDVPISLAKEMIAFVVKVFGDLTHGHLDALNQYMEQAIHIFAQVVEHINPKEVAALIAEEVLPEHWVAIVEKLIYSLGRRAAEKGVVGEYLVTEYIIKPLTTWTVGLVSGIFGKRDLKGWGIIDAVIDTLIDELVTVTTTWLGGLLGKRSAEDKGLLTSIAISVGVNLLLGAVGKRQTTGDYWDEFVDSVIDWGVSVIESAVTSLVTGFFGLFGKRDLKGWGIIGAVVDAVVETLIDELVEVTTTFLGGLFGKRSAEKGFFVNLGVTYVTNLLVDAVTGLVVDLFSGKRQMPSGF